MEKYLIEAALLAIFMVSATFFAGMIWLPSLPFRAAIGSELGRRFLMGLAMGATAVCLIYSPWGKISGAHINPAVTLSLWHLGKIGSRDALFYAIAQFIGGAAGIGLFKLFFRKFVGHPEVNFVQTLPGKKGVGMAFVCEALISFLLLLTVLFSSNCEASAPFTGVFAGCLVAFCITVEAPFSGMSMNPARSFASALAAGNFRHLWLYFLAPTVGMLGAAQVWVLWICQKASFECSLN